MISGSDKPAFRRAARTSIVAAGAAGRPSVADLREAEDQRAILEQHWNRYLRSQWVDAIVNALRSDILAARRHA